MSEQTVLQFPCEFTIKIFGASSDEFESAVIMIIRKHIAHVREDFIRIRPSKDGKYLAISATITASNQQQLDDIYRDLTADPHILMAL